MDDRTKAAHAGGEQPIGEGKDARTGSVVVDDMESLRGRATAAERQRDENLARLQRSRADFENYQKRIQRDQAEERRHAHAPFARELMPVLDNLQRALDAAGGQAEGDPLARGVALVRSQLLEILGRFGIMPIDALGRPFDPNQHEAVGQQPRTDAEPGTVVEVLEPGYRLHERVLRPARVVVASPASPGR